MEMLKDKVVVITGGSKGLGKATAQLIKSKGAQVIIVARNVETLKNTAALLNVDHFVADVSKEDEILKLYDFIDQKYGNIDVLINNAGLAKGSDTIDAIQLKDFEYVFGVNVFGAAIMTREASKRMIEKGSGDIINICSTAALKGYARGSIYAASKFALRAMTQCWQAELRPKNIRVIEINPTYVPTAFGTSDGVEKTLEDNKVKPNDIAFAIATALEMDRNAFIPELTVWATNPWS